MKGKRGNVGAYRPFMLSHITQRNHFQPIPTQGRVGIVSSIRLLPI